LLLRLQIPTEMAASIVKIRVPSSLSPSQEVPE
jgi:hypothetical protein